ncbi:hypothetical protein ES707_21219 [subsurface metagenome]
MKELIESTDTLPYAPAIIRLLQGVIYYDDRTSWDCLTQYQREIKNFFSGIGIDVVIFESEGFAFLRQKEHVADSENPLPGLIERRQLSYPVTLLCVILLEKLIEFDVKGGESTRLILDKEEIKDSMRIFVPENSNEAKLVDKIDTHINKLVGYGFLRQLSTSENKFEVRRILKAKVPADTLQEIKEKLREHAKFAD